MNDRRAIINGAADRGFTLVELLISILIVGIITVPLSNVVIGYLKNSNATTSRLSQSHDLQIAAAYLGQDVQSVGMRDYSTSPPTLVAKQSAWNSGFPANSCGSTIGPQKLLVGWDDFSSTSPGSFSATNTKPMQVYVAYVLKAADHQLYRVRCLNAAATGVTIALTHELAVTPAPSVTCDGGACGAAFPNSVALTLSIPGFSIPIILAGQRRQAS